MANEIFDISRANPFHWRIEYGPGSYVDTNMDYDIIPDMNMLMEDVDNHIPCADTCTIKTSFFLCDDRTKFQFQYNRVGYDPYLFVRYTNSNVWGRYRRPGQMNPTGSTWIANINFADFDCNSCIQFQLVSIGTDPAYYRANIFTDGDDGTMEANITGILSGGTAPTANVVSQNSGFFHSGTKSVEIAVDPYPAPNNKLIMNGQTPITLVSGQTYQASAWIYVSSAPPAPPVDDFYIDIKNVGGFSSVIGSDVGWTDALIIEKWTWFDSGAPLDTWVQIYTKFVVNTVTTGHLTIMYDVTPPPNTIVYIDDVAMQQVNTGIEATSEIISISDTDDCSIGVTYGAIPNEEHEQFKMVYSNSLAIYSNYFIRIPRVAWRQFKMDDSDWKETDQSSDNTAAVVRANVTKVNKFRAGQLPWWMLEKIPFIMKHDRVVIQLYQGAPDALNKEYICMTDDFVPKWGNDDFSLCGSVEWEMRPRLYNYQNQNCGAQ